MPPRLLPLLLALLTLLCWSAPAHATERLAVLELTGKSLTTDERATLTDTVRGAVVKALGGSVQVMTRENMEVMMSDMGMDATCVSEGACEVETARNLGVDYVISGSVTSMSGTQVVSLKLLETRTGQMLGSEQVMGGNALALMQALPEPATVLVGSLGGGAATVATARPTSTPIAARPVTTRPAAPSAPAVPGSDWTSPTLGLMKWIPNPAGGYWMMETEVTQAEWQAVMMGSNPSTVTTCGGACPVDRVSWTDVTAYATKLSEAEGVEYRLPTEAEWEYAANGDESYTYAGSDDVGTVAWYYANSGMKSHPVCEKQRNGYGLCDMSGNVMEWTATAEGSDRVQRGGGYYRAKKGLGVSFRYQGPPELPSMYDVGFRLIRSAP